MALGLLPLSSFSHIGRSTRITWSRSVASGPVYDKVRLSPTDVVPFDMKAGVAREDFRPAAFSITVTLTYLPLLAAALVTGVFLF